MGATADEGTITWHRLHIEARERLAEVGVPNPDQEARWLVEEASGNSGVDFEPGLDDLCTVRGVAHFDAMLARRVAGEPIQYVLGHWSFRQLDLMVDRRVLIPRPETEVVVGVALDELERQRGVDPLLAVDLGTGSGAIALSIAAETVDVHVVGVERSADALLVARANLAGLGRGGRTVQLLNGSWFEPLAGRESSFNLVVSNPPYIESDSSLPAAVRDWEPAGALFSGLDGLDDARQILSEAGQWLVPGGAVVMELGSAQLHAAAALASAAGLVDVVMVDDLAGLPRVLRARRP